MNILVVGSTGRTGRHLVAEALRRGHKVKALARSATKLEPLADDLEIRLGTPYEPADVSDAVQGVDAVLSSLNISRRSDFPWSRVTSPKDLISRSTRNIVAAMEAEQVSRIVVVSASGVGDSAVDLPAVFRWLIRASNIKYAYLEHEGQEELLRQSSLRWTAVRPSALSDKDRGKEVQASFEGVPKPGASISRANVARFMLRAVEEGLHVGAAPTISEG